MLRVVGIAVIVGVGLLGGGSAYASSTGSISGRVYIDVNGTGAFDANDVAVPNVNVWAAWESTGGSDISDVKELYSITDLPEATFNFSTGTGPCVDYLGTAWPGEYVIGYCPFSPTIEHVELADGEAEALDLAYVVQGSVNGRLWLGDGAAPDGTPLSVFVGDRECWTGLTTLRQRGQATVSTFDIVVEGTPIDPECGGADVSLRVTGIGPPYSTLRIGPTSG